MFRVESMMKSQEASLTIFPVPAADRVLQAGQPRGAGPLSPFIFDQALHDRAVPADFAEQVIEECGFP